MSRYEKVHWRIIPNYSERSDIMTVLKKSVRSDNPLSGKHIVFLRLQGDEGGSFGDDAGG